MLVIKVNEAGLMSSSDPIVLNYARTNERLLLTYNCDDFEELHQAQPLHPGILAIYRDNNSSKNMSFQEIVKAIAIYYFINQYGSVKAKSCCEDMKSNRITLKD